MKRMSVYEAMGQMSAENMANFIYVHGASFRKGRKKIKEFLQSDIPQHDIDWLFGFPESDVKGAVKCD